MDIKTTNISLGNVFCKYIFTFLFVFYLLSLQTAMAQDEIEFKGLIYEINTQTKTAMVTGVVSDDATEYIVPGMFEYGDAVYTVTAIDNGAFSNCEKATKITLPVTIESIGGSAFLTCKSLTSLHISGLITAIGDNTFQGCTSLTEIVIPATVTSIGKNAFKDTQLETIVCNGINPPSLKNNTFADLTLSDIQLIVPENQTDYSSASTWKKLDIQTVSRIDIDALRSAIDLLIPDTKTYDGTNSVQWSCPDYDHDGIADSIIAPLANIPTDKDVKVKIISVEYDYTRNKIVTKFTLIGDDVTEYVLTENVFEYDAELAPAQLTLVDCEPQDKDYDGNNKVLSVTGCKLNGVVLGDDVEISEVDATFVNAAPGEDKPVTFTSITLTGNDKGKYADNITLPTDKTATIFPYKFSFPEDTYDPLDPENTSHNTQSVYAEDKVYDGKLTATVHFPTQIQGFDGDVLTVTSYTANFDDKNAGQGKEVTISDIVFTCNNATHAGYYTLPEFSKLSAAITPKTVTVTSVTALDKEYDGKTTAKYENPVLNGIVEGETYTLEIANANFSDKNAADNNKTVTFSGFTLVGANPENYNITTTEVTDEAKITKKPLTLDVKANDKVYDGNPTASLAGIISLTGKIDGDKVDVSMGSNTFVDENGNEDANVGENKKVVLTGYEITGNDAVNYSFTVPDLKANITPAIIEVSGFKAENKVYDGTTDVTINTDEADYTCKNGSLNLPSINYTAAFVTKNAGDGKSVTVTFNTGTDNFTASLKESLTADITKRPVKIIGVTSKDKVYDGNTVAEITGAPTIVNADETTLTITGDEVSPENGSANFDTKIVGENKTVTFTGFSLSGADAKNYNLQEQPATIKNNITEREVTITWNETYEFDYDGEKHIRAAEIGNVVIGDKCSLEIEEKKTDVGDYTATVTALSGDDASNYKLPDNTTADFKILKVNPIISESAKPQGIISTYDKTAQELLTAGTITGGEFVYSLEKNGNYTTTIPKGTNAGEYTIYYKVKGDGNHNDLDGGTITAKINPKSVTIEGVTSKDKIYDGDAKADVVVTGATIDGNLDGEDLQIVQGTASFSDKNVETNKTVTFKDFSLGGSAKDNYTLSKQPESVENTISQKTVTFSGLAANEKVYDGNKNATIVYSDVTFENKIDGDNLSITGGTATFDTPNVGDNKDVTISGYALGGADAGNYVLSSTADVPVKSKITAKEIGVVWENTELVYNCGPQQPTCKATGLCGDDACEVTVTVEGEHTNANVGNETYTATATALNNPNYKLPNPNPTTTFVITPKPIDEIIWSNTTVTYNGTNQIPTATPKELCSSTDECVITVTGEQKNAKTTPYIVAATSVSNTNYKLPSTGTTHDFTINPKPIDIEWNKKNVFIYNGKEQKPEATVNAGELYNGDECSVDVSGAQKNVGTYTAEASLSNANYSIKDASRQKGFSITPATLTITANSKTITYGDVADNDGVTYSAFAGDEDKTVLTGNLTYSYKDISEKDYEPGSIVGEYKIMPSGLSNDNYNITYEKGILTVEQREVTITWNDEKEFPYDGTEHIRTATIGNVVNNDDCKLVFAEKKIDAGDDYISTASLDGAKKGNYKLPSNTTAEFSITRVAPTFETLSGLTLTYNGTNQQLINSANVSGGEYQYSLEKNGTYSTTIPTGKNVDSYTVYYKIVGDNNHTTTDVNWFVTTIKQKEVSIKGVKSSDKPYDGTKTASIDISTATIEGNLDGGNLTIVPGKAEFAQSDAGENINVIFSGFTLEGSAAGNYKLATDGQPSSVENKITKVTLTVTAKPNTITYGQAPKNAGVEYSGFVNNEKESNLTGSWTYAYSYNQYDNVGNTYTIAPTLQEEDKNYTFDFKLGTLTVNPKPIEISWDTEKEFTYDGKNHIRKAELPAGGLENNDNCTLTFATEQTLAREEAYTSTATLTGTKAGNYTITNPTAEFKINKATPEITIAKAENLVYNGYDQDLLKQGYSTTGGTLLFKVDDGEYSTSMPKGKNAKQSYTVYYKVVGNNNYNDVVETPLTVEIAKRLVEIANVKSANKTYDGTTEASIDISESYIPKKVSGDDLTINITAATATFKEATVGTWDVTFDNFALDGQAKDNYELSNQPEEKEYEITKANLTISNVTASDKTYDGKTTATATLGTLNGVIGNDVVTLVQDAANFSDKNVGTDKTVTVEYHLDGADAKNYSLTQPVTTTASILQISIEVTAEDKTITYGDNAPNYTVTYSNGFIDGETSSSVVITAPTFVCEYDINNPDKRHQGTYDIIPSGAAAQNYSFTYVKGELKVNPKTVALSWSVDPLIYDAKKQHPKATVKQESLAYTGDVCKVSEYEGAETDAGTNYTVSATKLDNSDYVLPNDASKNYDIGKMSITIVGLTAENKVYNGTTVATTTGGTLDGVFATDDGKVTIKPGTATFADKDVANNIEVTFTNYELEGDRAFNYVLSAQPIKSAANITKAKLTVTANDHTIFYGDEPSNNGVTYSGFVDGENAANNLSNTLEFSYSYQKGKNCGNYEITPSNLESQNYEFEYVNGKLTVVEKVIEIVWGDKVFPYDKQTHQPVAKVVGDNDCEVSVKVLENENGVKDAGYYTAQATALSNPNYALPTYNLKTGFEITPQEVKITWSNTDLDYDGTAQKPTATAVNLVEGDKCTITVSGAQVNAGTYTATAVEVSNRNYKLPSNETVNQTFTIKKVVPEITEPIEYTLTYNGENQVLIMAGSTTAGEMLYSLNGTDYSKSLPTAKNANNYTVYYKVVGNTNFTDVEPQTITPVIEKAPFKVTADDKTITYGDATPTITFSYDGFVEGESTTNITVGSANYLNYTGNAGVYTIEIDEDKFSADNYDLQFTNGTFTVLQKEVEVSWDYTQPYPYDGQEHCPKATVETVSGDVCNVTVSGTQTNAGEYTAKATSIDNDNYKLIMNDKIYQEFEIKPKGVTVQWDGNIFEYDGTAKYPKANVKAEDIVGSDVCEVVVSGANVAVGNYTATAVELSNRNYVIANGKTHDYKITPTLPSPVVAPKPNNSVYNGFEQNLVSAGSTTAGEMLYSLSRDGEFNTALPQAKNADNYTVYYKVRGNSNYSDTEIGEVNVTIEKAPLRVLWGELSFVYNHEEQKPEATVSGLFANEVIDVAVNGGKVNGGNYTATASIESDNYQLEEPTTIEFEILPKKLMIGKVDVQIVKDYDGNNTAEITSELPTNAYEGDNYNLRATAVYNDAEVSTNKVITLSFSLEDNPNYYLDDNEKEYVYSREAIIVGTPTLVLDEDKLYAYPASEIGNDIYAEAFYNGEKLSGRMTYEPKSGTVLRALDEKQEVVARFVPDQNCYKEVSQTFAVMVSNKIETNNIRITVDVTNEYLCSNKVLLEYEVLTGKVERYEITFDDSRFESMEGIADNNSQILINLPENLEAGTYKGKIVFFDMAGNVSYPCDFSFTTKIAAKSLFQLYKDVVFVNGDYVDYQWYKNGNMLDGQTGQYLSEDKDLYGTYYALVTNKNGEKYETCPLEIYPTIKKRNAVLSVYPNPAVSMQDIHIDIEDFDEDKTAEIKIYTNGGILVQHIKNAQPENIVNLRSGNYTGVFTQNGVRLSFKIIVK